MTQDRKTVLFIDDEPFVLSSLRRVFHGEHWNMLFAEGGTQGLEMMAETPVNAVVCDLQMPGLNGVSVLEKVQALYPEAGRLMLSAYVEEDSLERALAEECAHKVLSKPWNDEQLKAAISTLL